MNADKALLVSKLILVVLVLILGCLVVLVVQNGRKDQLQHAQAAEIGAGTAESSETREPDPVS